MDFREVREKYPQYDDLPDDQLAAGLHKKFYSDIPFEEFSQKVGYSVNTGSPEVGTSSLEADQAQFTSESPWYSRLFDSLQRGYQNYMGGQVSQVAAARGQGIGRDIQAFQGDPGNFELLGDIQNRQQVQNTDISAIARHVAEAQKIPVSPVSQAVSKADTFGDAFSAAGVDPIDFIANTFAESIPHMSEAIQQGIMGGRVAGLPGLTVGTASGSFDADAAASLFSGLAEYGVDISNPQALQEAFQNPTLIDALRKQATLHAGPVALLDALSARMASKVLAPKSFNPITRELTNVGAQAGAQAVAGGAGEAGGQVLSEGKIKPGEIVAEMAGEMASAPSDIVTAMLAGTREQIQKPTEIHSEGGPVEIPKVNIADIFKNLNQSTSLPDAEREPGAFVVDANGNTERPVASTIRRQGLPRPPGDAIVVNSQGMAGKPDDLQNHNLQQSTEQFTKAKQAEDMGYTSDIVRAIQQRQSHEPPKPKPKGLPHLDPEPFYGTPGGDVLDGNQLRNRDIEGRENQSSLDLMGYTQDVKKAIEQRSQTLEPFQKELRHDRGKQAMAARLPKQLNDPRLARDEFRGALERMSGELTKGGDVAYIRDEHDRITGRTSSINPSWFQSIAKEYGVTTDQVKTAVEKSLKGDSLGVNQVKVITAMLDEHRGERTNPANIEYVRKELARSRRLRNEAKLGDPPIEAYESDYEHNAGQVFHDEEYLPEMDGIGRGLLELSQEAVELGGDYAAIDEILSMNAKDGIVAQRLYKYIGELNERQGQAEQRRAEPEGISLEEIPRKSGKQSYAEEKGPEKELRRDRGREDVEPAPGHIIETLREDLKKSADDMGAFRSNMFHQRLNAAAEGRDQETVDWAMDWYRDIEKEATDRKAKEKLEKDEFDNLEQSRKARSKKEEEKLDRGESDENTNQRYAAYLDTLDDPSTRNNPDYFAFISNLSRKFKSKHGERPFINNQAGEWNEKFDEFIREHANNNLADRLKAPSDEGVSDSEEVEGNSKDSISKISPKPEKDAKDLKGGPYPISYHNAIIKASNDGSLSLSDFHAALDTFLSNQEEIKTRLNKYNKDILSRMSNRYLRGDEKKPKIVEFVMERFLDFYTLNHEVPNLTYSFGEDFDKVKADHRQKIIDIAKSTTQKDLEKYADGVKANRKEKEEAKVERQKAIENPESLEDYRLYIRTKAQDEGISNDEARMTLSPEQRAKYDDLSAEASRTRRDTLKEERKTHIGSAGATTQTEIIETTHTKKGHDLFVVKTAERVERDIYKTWLSAAKKMGGWYSAYRGNGAVPGFQFKDLESAKAFQSYVTDGDTEAVESKAKERRDAFADDRSQSAVERLNEMSESLEEKATESLNTERKTNTQRRAGMAARAEAQAEYNKSIAITMRNIASAIDAGEAKFLNRVRTKTQVEMLNTFINLAKDKQLREKYPDYGERIKHEGEAIDSETVDFTDHPTYTVFRSDLAKLGREALEVDGLKKIGQRIMKVADDVTDAYLSFAKENLHRVASFSSKDGGKAAFKSKKIAEESILRSGFRGQAIVLPVKRGENLIILSPSEAKKRGIWEGDNDKRITLDDDLVNSLIGKARRQNRLTVPWQLDAAHEKLTRLKSMGIETLPEFRAALREFVKLREEQAKPDKIKEMERAMIGRRKDGLDFFPTSESTSDEMIEVAEIEEGMKVLEPSAGMGHIAERIREAGIEPDVVELSGDRRELLEAKGFNVVGHDFLEVTEGGYDRILMNPPFSDRRDMLHIQHAYDLLKPGGRLVAIAGEGVFFGSDKKALAFREWLYSVGATDEKLPEGSFQDPKLPVNTGVHARMVVIDKSTTIDMHSFGDTLFNKEEWQKTAKAIDEATGTEYASKATNHIIDQLAGMPWAKDGPLARGEGKVNLWNKSVGTPYQLASKSEEFSKYFWETQAYINDIAKFVNAAEGQLQSWFKGQSLVAKAWKKATNEETASIRKVGDTLLEGTLEKKIYTTPELIARGFTDPEIIMYQEARDAIDWMIAKTGESMIVQGAEVDEVFERVRNLQNEGYYPLSRFGSDFVVVHDPRGDVREFHLEESKRKAKARQSELMRKYPQYRVERGTLSTKGHKLFKGVTPDTVELFADLLEVAEDPVMQEYLKHVASQRSAMKRMIHRKGTPGYSHDALRVMADFIVSNSRLHSGAKHFSEMRKLAEDIKAGDVKDYAVDQLDYLQDPGEEFAGIRGYLFFHFLGGNISSALVNLTQIPVATMPWMTQHTSHADASVLVTKAMKDAVLPLNQLTGDAGKALRRAESEGITNAQDVYQMMGIASGSKIARIGEAAQFLDAWAYLFSWAEIKNRRTTFLAAYRVGRKKGKSHDEAYEFAVGAVDDTQFIYNKGNRPKWARGVMAVPFTFKLFTINLLELISRMPKKQAAILLAGLVMMAGAEGLPFAEDLEDIIDGIGQKAGYPTNSKKWLRETLDNAFTEFFDWSIDKPEYGEIVSQMVRHGVFSPTPFNIGSRVSMGNILPGTGLLKTSEDRKLQEFSEALGPAAGVIKGAVEGAELLAEGQVNRAIEKAAPIAIGNIFKGMRQFEDERETTSTGNKVVDFEGYEKGLLPAGKSIGFQSNKVSKYWREMMEAMQDERFFREAESRILDAWARGVIQGDKELIDHARSNLREYNGKIGKRSNLRDITLVKRRINQRVKNMRRSGRERLLKSVSPARRGDVARGLSD